MKIYKLGEDIIRQKCVPVEAEEINDSLRETFNEMFETMLAADGVGLAAPQIGVAKRYFVIISDRFGEFYEYTVQELKTIYFSFPLHSN